MGEVINLRQKRKTSARTEKEKTASQNRLKFGRTKAEKEKQEMLSEKAKRLLDGHKTTPDDDKAE